MQDYILRNIDINQKIETITVKQFDNDSRFVHITISDIDLTDGDGNAFDLEDCCTALYIQPEGNDDPTAVNFVEGTIESAESGIVTFLLPGGVTNTEGRYECEIWIYQGDGTTRPVISTKPFSLIVEKSILNDSAIEATQDMSALNAKMVDIQTVKNQISAIMAMADAGEIPAGTVEAEVAASRVGWNGAMGYNREAGAFQFGGEEYSSLGAALTAQVGKLRDMGLIYLGTFLNRQTWDTVTLDGSKTFAGLPTNIFAICNTVEATNPISDAPVSGPMSGYIFTFGRADKNYRRNFDTQVFMQKDRAKIWARVYDGSAWSAWSVIGGKTLGESIDGLASQLATVPQFRSGVNDSYTEKNYLLSNVTDDGTFFVSQTDASGGTIVRRWNDLPTLDQNFIVTNTGYSSNWILQTAIPTDSLGTVYNRLIPRPDAGGSPRDWMTVSDIDTRLKVLAVGDSICAGWRNGNKGFVGDLGLPYKNIGVSGATLSTKVTTVTNIPDRFIEFFNYHSKTVNAQNDGWEPDIIIANGGHNDYGQDAPLGNIPTEPAASIGSLDLSTAMGGLQKLFLLMIEKYPKAQRFFLTPHKIYRNVPGNDPKNGYLPTKLNGHGYTETQLHDAIVACCNVYNVKVIDAFNDSMINSLFDGYRGSYYYGSTYSSDPDYRQDSLAPGDTENYFDKDGVHPLSRGYLEGYKPLILAALKGNTSCAVHQTFLSQN